MKKIIPFILILFFLTVACGDDDNGDGTTTKYSKELTKSDLKLLDDLVKLAQSQESFGDSVLIALVRKHNRKLPLSTEKLIELKKKGLSDHVITKLITGFED